MFLKKKYCLSSKICFFSSVCICSSLLVLLYFNCAPQVNWSRKYSAFKLQSSARANSYLGGRKDLSKYVTVRRYPRMGEPGCHNFSINLYQENTFEPVGLVSYPGSGNTWLRHLIEFSTGVFTGSIYFDEDLFAKGFLGEKEIWDAGSTIVQKLHLKYSRDYPFRKAILLVREPYSAIVSFVHFLESGHLGFATNSTFYHEKWPKYVLGQTFSWMTLIKSWVESPCKVLVVYYEKLVADLKAELVRICQFLDVPCTHIHTPCFEKNVQGLFHRRRNMSKSPPLLDGFALPKLNAGLDYISQLLLRFGHDPLPTTLYKYYK